jgi:hypothetical protein
MKDEFGTTQKEDVLVYFKNCLGKLEEISKRELLGPYPALWTESWT